jgi:zinc protease
MKFQTRFHILCAIAFVSTVFAAQSATPLPEDSRIQHGKFDNGVHWMYRQHNNPPGKMAIKVHVRTGSLNETEDQRGLAHFLEHMAFNGTEHFPPGKLIPYFESIGMQFGAHLNASTSFDETIYMLYTPNTEVEQIDKALMVLSDYVFRDNLSEDEINKERGIILEEARSGKNAFQRIRDKLWPELFSGSRFAKRLPIGDEGVIAKAPRKQFEEYYRRWYRPENITVLLVGDSAPDKIIPLIGKWFGEYKPSAPAEKEHGPEFKPFTEERALVVTDPEMAYCQIQMLNLKPGRPATVTEEQWRTELVEYLGSWIIGRRFDDRVKKAEASYRGAGASIDDFFHDALLAAGFATGEAADWNKMLTELITEVSRAREFGFSERELQLARREILADAERSVRTEPTRNARELIDEMVSSANNKTPILSAQENLKLYQKYLSGVTAAEVSGAFKSNFAPGTYAYTVTMAEKEKQKAPSQTEVLSVAKQAWAQKVQPIKEAAVITNLLSQLPKPAKILDQKIDKDLGVTSAWLANGVRVHHRFMDYKKDSVFLSISLTGGTLEETAANVGITEVASLAINEAATSKIDSSRMRDFTTGKNISVSAGPAGDNFTVTVNGSPIDLEFGLQEAYALLTDGRIEDAAFKNWKLARLQQMVQREKLPAFKAQEAMEELLSNNDPRRGFLDKSEVEALSVPAAQAWFERLCRTAPIEVAIVGDIKLEPALALVSRYIGSLPKRERSSKSIDKLRESARKPGPLSREVSVETVTPQAVSYAGFAASEAKNISDSRALELASYIMSSRLVKEIREEQAIVYSIHANNVPSWIYTDAGRFYAGAPCDPKNARKVVDEVHKLFKAFAENGPTDEELANAKKQVANVLDTSMREPSYWWSVLRNLDLRHRDLNAEKTIKEDYQKYTREEIRNAFQKYYVPSRIFWVTAVPTAPTTAGK